MKTEKTCTRCNGDCHSEAADLRAALAAKDAEIERLKAEVETLAWNLGGISTLACGRKLVEFDSSMARPALHDVAALVTDYSALAALAAKDAEIERLRNVLGRPELLENLAATEHERWSGWMKYQAEKTGKTHPVSGEVYEDRWKRQSQTAYAQLPEAERESDRIEARKTLAIIRAALANAAPEHKPETCVWTVNVTENSWILGCDESKDTSAPPKVCPYCKKRVEVKK